ncbi:unnamed protein product [Sympodiomycopsis kandeliae]
MTSWAKRMATGGGGNHDTTTTKSHHQSSSQIPSSSSQPIEYIAPRDHSTSFRHGKNQSMGSGSGFSKFFSPSSFKKKSSFGSMGGGGGGDWQVVDYDNYPFPSSSSQNQLRLSTGEAFTMASSNPSHKQRRRSSAANGNATVSGSGSGSGTATATDGKHAITLGETHAQRIQSAERSQRIDEIETDPICPILSPEQVRGISPSINIQLQSFAFPTSSPDLENEPQKTPHPPRGKSRSMGNALELANMAGFERKSYEQRRKSKPSLPSNVLPPEQISPSPMGNTASSPIYMHTNRPIQQQSPTDRKRAISMITATQHTGSSGSNSASQQHGRTSSRGLARKFSLLRYGRSNGNGNGADSQMAAESASRQTIHGSSSTGADTQSTPRRPPEPIATPASTSATMPNPMASAKKATSPFGLRRLSIKRGRNRSEQVSTPEIESWRDTGMAEGQDQKDGLVEPPIMVVQPTFLDQQMRGASSPRNDPRSGTPMSDDKSSSLRRNASGSGSTSLRRRWQTRSKSFDLFSNPSRSGSRATSAAGSEAMSPPSHARSNNNTPLPSRLQDMGRPSMEAASILREIQVPRKPVPSYLQNELEASTPKSSIIPTESSSTSIVTSAAVANEPHNAALPSHQQPRARRLRGGLSPKSLGNDQTERFQNTGTTTHSGPASPAHFATELDAMSIHHAGETTDGGFSDVASTIRPQRIREKLRRAGPSGLKETVKSPIVQIDDVDEGQYDADESGRLVPSAGASTNRRRSHLASAEDGGSTGQSNNNRLDPNDSIGSTNSAGRPYSMISVGSGDTPIVRYRRLIVDTTTEGEHEESDHPEGQLGLRNDDSMWFRRPGKQRTAVEGVFSNGPETQAGLTEEDEQREQGDQVYHLDPAAMDRRTSSTSHYGSNRRASMLTSDGDTALSALEAEVATAKRMIVGRSRANTLDLMKHIEREQSADEQAQADPVPKLPEVVSGSPLPPDVHVRAEPIEPDSMPLRRDDGDHLQQQTLEPQTSRNFMAPKMGLNGSRSSTGLTSTSSEDDGQNAQHPSPLIDNLRTTKSGFLSNRTIPQIPSSSLLRKSQSAINSRPSPHSSPDIGTKPDEFEPPPPPPTLSKISFLGNNKKDINDIEHDDVDMTETGIARHVKSKSSLRTRGGGPGGGNKKTFATSEEAIQARQREEQGKEKRRQQREKEKEKLRQRRYADMKKNDPLLAERLALVGLKPAGTTVVGGVSAVEGGPFHPSAQESQWPHRGLGIEEGVKEQDHFDPRRSSERSQGDADTIQPEEEATETQTQPDEPRSPPPRLPPILALGHRTPLDDSFSFEKFNPPASLSSQNSINAEAEMVTPPRGTASDFMSGLSIGQEIRRSPTSPKLGSRRRTMSLSSPWGTNNTSGQGQLGESPTIASSVPSGSVLGLHRPSKSLSQTLPGGSLPGNRGHNRVRGDSNATNSMSASAQGTPIPCLDFPDPPERGRESRSADGTVLSMGELTSPLTQWADLPPRSESITSNRSQTPQGPSVTQQERGPIFIYAAHPSTSSQDQSHDNDPVSQFDSTAETATPKAATFPLEVQRERTDPEPVLKKITRSRSKIIKPPAGPRPQPAVSPELSSPLARPRKLSSTLGMNDTDPSAAAAAASSIDSRHRSMMVEIENVNEVS